MNERGSSGEVALRAAHYRTGEVQEFRISGDRLIGQRRVRGPAADGLVFGPGLLDLQCNGYAGVDFNHPQSTVEEIRQAIRVMRRHGCTVVLPTVITAEADRLEFLFKRLVEVLEAKDIARSVPGFHLEGPFISGAEGARGAHPLAAVRRPNRRLWDRVQRAAAGHIRLLTLAPELPGALPFIRTLRTGKVLCALGHTLATTRQIAAAAEAGATMSTHLGNGCPQTLARHANPIFAQLGEDRLAASVIPDGIHLPAEVLRSIARAKGAERIVIVTDAMAAAGAGPGRYRLGDLMVEVGSDEVVRQPGTRNLAGSALTMDQAVARFRSMTGASLAEAWDAASVRPAALLRNACAIKQLDLGTLIVDERASGFIVVCAARARQILWCSRAM